MKSSQPITPFFVKTEILVAVVLIAVADHIPSSFIDSPPHLEALCIKISHPIHPILVCCIYIPPNPNVHYFQSYISYLFNLTTSHDPIIFLGDFNLPDINWSSLSCTSFNSTLLCDFVAEHNLPLLAADHFKPWTVVEL